MHTVTKRTNTKYILHSFVYANTGASDPIGTCKVYETGGFSTEACNDQSHDYGYITGAPAITSPDTVFVACPTECPEADGREYKSKGEVSYHEKRASEHILTSQGFPHGLCQTTRNSNHC